MDSMTDVILASFYLLLWIGTFILYHFRFRNLDGGSLVIFFYIIYGACSIFVLQDVLFSMLYNPLQLFPYIYLYVMMMIALAPAIYNHFVPSREIEDPQSRTLILIAIAFIFCGLTQVPNIILHFDEGLVKLFTDTDAGKDAYGEHLDEAGEAGSGITNLFSIYFNATFEIAIFLFFYFLSQRKKNKWVIIGLAFSIFIGTMLPVMQGLRGGVIISLQTCMLGYLFFRQYLSKKINRLVQIAGVSAVVLASLPVVAITLSRFGDNRVGGVMGFLNWYVGQGSLYFNNYGLDDGGIRNGDRVFNLFKRVVDPENTPKNFFERRDKYHNLEIDDEVFSTFVGDFTIDLGPITAFLLFVAFNAWVISRIRPRDGTLRLHQALLIYFTLCISIQGGMSLFYFADTGGLKMITFILFYVYLVYHEKLLESFPATSESKV